MLRGYAWGRLGLAALLTLVGPVIPAELVPGAQRGILALTVFVVLASSAVLLLLPPGGEPRRMAWLACFLDVALVTAVVTATGGPRSIFTFLYVLTVTAACVLLPRAGAVAVAATGSLLYTGVVFARTVFPLTMLFDAPEETSALEVLTMFMNAGTFLVVAIVAGGLADRFRTARAELATERQNLEDLRAFQDVILRSVGTGLVVLDPDHRVTALNQAAERIIGRSAGRAIGDPATALFGEGIRLDDVETALDSDGAAPAAHEISLRRSDGAVVPVRLTFSALRSGDGHRLGLIAVCEDLSRLREMEARMRQADRLAAVGRMAANIAHEIRNPLASLTGAIEALTARPGTDAERERLGQIVAGESERLNRIIKDFLAYARPAPLQLARVEVVDVLDNVLLLLEHRALPPGLKIVRECPPSLPWRLDPHQLRQAVWNLCLNAVEAMPAGGELRVGVARRGPGLVVSVADTGSGIAPENLPHVFEPFYSTKPEGSGLGLALVHRIVREHGGDVEVRSQAGGGTVFTLTLPGGGDG
jgi:two-component system sensor histidine kinase PilS (NtrC family)